jgi:hypothetical protein
MCDTATVSANTGSATSAATGSSTAKAPRPVATPLPPCSPSQAGNTWPTTAAEAASACATRSSGASRRAIATASAPFATSSPSASAPAPLPALRSTSVAPTLPLPTWRTSRTPKARATRKLHGTEPIRYASRVTPSVSSMRALAV